MGEWYVLYSKPRKERLLHDQLTQRGVEAFLPMFPPHGRQQAPHALFPRYLFARLDADQMSPAVVNWLPGLTSFVRFGGEYAIVPDAVVSYVRRRAAEMQSRGAAPFLHGQPVRITGDHPLAQLSAVFDRPLSGGARARILIELLGRLTRCDVDVRDLEPIGGLHASWGSQPIAVSSQ
ncbi:MAG: hypothetical protein GX657_15920 [Chloroflexi bacterium]|jgi:transcriptional antiterminator RfaH|nr:hypothetical protein [Chloroflexota bacterium]